MWYVILFLESWGRAHLFRKSWDYFISSHPFVTNLIHSKPNTSPPMDHRLALMHLLRPLLVVLGGTVGDFCQGLSTQGLLKFLTSKVGRLVDGINPISQKQDGSFQQKKRSRSWRSQKQDVRDYARKYSVSCEVTSSEVAPLEGIHVSHLQTNHSTNQVPTNQILHCM